MITYNINFNQDFTSLAVVGTTGYRLFTLSSVEKVEEIFCSHNENTRIAERLFSSSLVAVVTVAEPNKLKICHFKKGSEICNYSYPSDILSVRLNRARLIVSLRDSIYIHNIRDMKLLHSIRHVSPNEVGLCSLSLNSHLAYPISSTNGELQIFDANKLLMGVNIQAHDSSLSAINFSPDGALIATASERGTVIRVFCTKNARKVHEFRRGVKRNVNIASLMFNSCAEFLCASSNTETVHIFKIDGKSVENAERQSMADSSAPPSSSEEESKESLEDASVKAEESSSSWTGFFSKAVQSYLPSQVSDVFSQDRAFATVQLNQPGLKYVCALAKLEKQTRLLMACEDGFLYIYEFNEARKGGDCKLIRVHDLRNPLEGVTELDMNDSYCDRSQSSLDNISSNSSKNSSPKSQCTYAGILKGSKKDILTVESDKCRDLSEAVDYPTKSIFDDRQFPPVATVRE